MPTKRQIELLAPPCQNNAHATLGPGSGVVRLDAGYGVVKNILHPALGEQRPSMLVSGIVRQRLQGGAPTVRRRHATKPEPLERRVRRR